MAVGDSVQEPPRHHDLPALLCQVGALILQPLALGRTVFQQNVPPSLDSVQPVNTLRLDFIFVRGLEVLHHRPGDLLANFSLPAE